MNSSTMAYKVAKVIATNNIASKKWKIFKNGRLNDFGKSDAIVNYPNKTKEISLSVACKRKKHTKEKRSAYLAERLLFNLEVAQLTPLAAFFQPNAFSSCI